MRKMPKAAKPMDTAPKDGAVIDLWHPTAGWVTEVWWDNDFEKDEGYGDGWVTICPRPFDGWRYSVGIRQ